VIKKVNILYEFEEISKPPFFNEVRITRWLNTIASSRGSSIKHIQYIFCDDEYLLEVNKEHLNHDYYTDIITFPYEEGKVIEADILISLERVGENADEYKVTFENELLRVMVHGLLHLTGMKDKTEEEMSLMRKAENEAILNY
jgi:probable rRNA maturation factor